MKKESKKESKKALVAKPSKKISKPEGKKKKVTNRFNKLRLKGDDSSRVVYIGHLPKGFEENELKQFFGQFGDIKKARVARSSKSGRSKGYAFLQFEEKEVADIAASTMNGHMIFKKQLECHLVDAPHKDTFKHGNREWKFIPSQLIFRNKKNKAEEERTDDQRAARVAGLLEKEVDKRRRLKELGIEYDFPGYQALVDQSKADKPARKSSHEKHSDKHSDKPSRKSSHEKHESKSAEKKEKSKKKKKTH